MAVRNKEMLLMRASKLRELPKSTHKDRDNNKKQNVETLVSIRSFNKPVLSEADFRPFSRNSLCEIGYIVFLISQTLRFSLFLKQRVVVSGVVPVWNLS